MNAKQLQRVEELFHAALEQPSDVRSAFLNDRCAEDGELRAEIEALLESDAQSPEFIIASSSLIAAEPVVAAPQAGDHIGPYRLVREIGHGGMGEVWLAERDDARFQKQVAIKLVQSGLFDADDSSGAMRRFCEEWQILARLEHPNIARLIDGGERADGLPWLALEYVKGERIDRYCHRRNLSIEERLRLFRKVCEAVHYAHQNLIVHRDLKPDNILIAEDGAPKLLDFGIARLLDAEGAPRDVTLTGQRMLTLHYASPEQVRGLPITTASDVYSLGAVLYELLTGKRPYDIAAKSLADAVRIVGEHEPVKPSLATGPERPRRQLTSDLDNIVLMALRKEPARRYASVKQFSDDIRRHLEGKTVTATEDTLAYRSMKFVRRNTAGVAAVAMIVLSLMAGGAFAAWQATIAGRERDNARSINGFYLMTLSHANPQFGGPGHGKGADVKLVDAIRASEKLIDVEFKDQPQIRIDLHHSLGQMWWLRGDHQSAEPHFLAAMELNRQVHGEHHPVTIQNLYKLGLTTNVRGEHLEAIEQVEKSIVMMRKYEPGNEALPYMLRDLGEILRLQGRFSEAEGKLLEARELFKKTQGSDDDPRMNSISEYLAKIDLSKGEMERAEAGFQAHLDHLTRLPNMKYEAGYPLFYLGIIQYTRGDSQKAEKSLTEADKLFSFYIGSDPLISRFLYYLTSIHCQQKDFRKAESEARRALEMNQQSYSSDHPLTITSAGLLSKVLIMAGHPNRAVPILNGVLEKYRAASKRNSWEWLEATGMLGECLTLLKHYDEAERLLNESYTGLHSIRGEKSPEMVEVRQRLIKLYAAWRRLDQVVRYQDSR